jgi:ABC-type metal ion transport system, periplasmic component/surface adhesin
MVNDNSSTNHHSWLDVDHIQRFSVSLTDKLAQIDVDNAATYKNNLTLLNQKLEQLKRNTNQQLSKHSTTQIATFSNTFEYFINSNHLQRPTIITQSHGERLSIHKILKGKKSCKSNKQSVCLAQ